MKNDDDTQQLAPILADEALEVRNPRRRVRLIAVLFAAAILLCSAAAGYAGAQFAIYRSAAAQRALVRDLEQRRQVRDGQVAQQRADLCLILRQLPSPALDDVRGRYGCGPAVPAPTPGPTAILPTTSVPDVRPPTPSTVRPTERAASPRDQQPAPAPTPPARTTPPTGPSPPPPAVCLPLLGCVL